MFDTIAAISTGDGNKPISIIRVSGPNSFLILKKIFSGKIGEDKTITYGYIKDNKEIIDEVLVLFFKGPNTFTGEDIVEINAHGGIINSNRILELLLINGARMAENGEFSRRSFLNGKIDLIKAEAIHDLIFAKNVAQAKLSVSKFDSQTSRLISKLKDKIMRIIATCETNIDYPEYEDIEQLTTENLIPKLKSLLDEFNEIIKSSEMSRSIYEGVDVAIVGKPNVGKSSLLNSLLQNDKAIVTNIPGTTRDIVEGQLTIGNVLFKFIDTAGLRDAKDEVEKIGVNKTLEKINNSTIIIHLIDPTSKEDSYDEIIEKNSLNKTYLKVYNKSDIKSIENEICISAKNDFTSPLTDELTKLFSNIDIDNSRNINNTRQFSLIKKSRNEINSALDSLKNGMTPDVVIVDIQEAWNNLANIQGRAEHDHLLDDMFKNFCLGK